MLVSAIVPIGDFLKDKLQILNIIESCAEPKIELILVLDSQLPACVEFLQQYLRDNQISNVKIKESKCRNPGETRNVGLRAASGEWIVFWDSDDIPNVTALISGIKEYEIISIDVLVFNFKQQPFSATLKSTGTKLDFCSVSVNPGVWRFAFRSEFIRGIFFKPFKMGEDQIFICEVLARNPNISFSNIDVYTYIMGVPNQLTSSRLAIAELFYSINEVIKIVFKYKGKHETFFRSILIKQVITGIVNPNSHRIDIIKAVISFFLTLKFKSKITFVCLSVKVIYLTVYFKIARFR